VKARLAGAGAVSGALIFLLGCAGPTIQVRVLVPAEVDLLSRDIDSLGVMKLGGDPEVAGHVTESLTTKLGESEFFKVVERSRLDQVVGELRRGLSDLVDPKTAAEAGRLLGVKAVVVGQVMAYRIVDTPYAKQVRKRVGTGRFRTVGSGRRARKEEIMKEVLVTEKHTRREGVLSVSLRVVEVATGRILASQTVDHALKYDTGLDALSALFSKVKREIPPPEATRRDLVEAVSTRYFEYVSPWYVTIKRTLESAEGAVDTGVKFAKAGSLKEAIRIWTDHVWTRPKSNEALYNLGVAYEALGQLERARTAYRRALRLATKDLYIKALADLNKQILERKKVGRKPAGD